MGLFVDADGNSIKFFLQRDFHDDVKNDLKEKIHAEGGRVEDKIPIKGYILVDFGSPEAERLRGQWSNKPDRPERFLVPFKWVDACRAAGKLLVQMFRDGSEPITFHIHESIANPIYRQELYDRIIFSGGNPDCSKDEATVILADPHTDIYKTLEKLYVKETDHYLQSYEFIQQCIDRGYFHLGDKPAYKNPGGRRPGEERTAFTADDEAKLCMWIASVIPCKESGGRTGNKIYQELVTRHELEGFDWVKRHPWQSWRERYKKNSTRLDQQIQTIVDSKRSIAPPDKSQFGIFRIQEHKPNKPSRKRKRVLDQEVVDAEHLHTVPVPIVNGMAPPIMSQVGDEWAIRDGIDPTPPWARRATVEPITGPSGQGNIIPQADNVDWRLNEISQKYQFFENEVRDYFNKCKDFDKTVEHFFNARTYINSLP